MVGMKYIPIRDVSHLRRYFVDGSPASSGSGSLSRTIRPVSSIRADGNDISIEGPEPELVDVNQPVLNLRDALRPPFGRHTCRR